jgi:hypothetical protein
MSWGVFEIKDPVGRLMEVHVAPSTRDGLLVGHHTLTPGCYCQPEYQDEGPRCAPVYIHNLEN